MDEEQLRAIQARCGAATPGPWVASYNYSNVVEFDLYSSVKMFSCGPTLQGSWDAIGPQAIADAAFIAAARQDVPALLAELADLDARQHDARVGREPGGVVEAGVDRVELVVREAALQGPEREDERRHRSEEQEADQ